MGGKKNQIEVGVEGDNQNKKKRGAHRRLGHGVEIGGVVGKVLNETVKEVLRNQKLDLGLRGTGEEFLEEKKTKELLLEGGSKEEV